MSNRLRAITIPLGYNITQQFSILKVLHAQVQKCCMTKLLDVTPFLNFSIFPIYLYTFDFKEPYPIQFVAPYSCKPCALSRGCSQYILQLPLIHFLAHFPKEMTLLFSYSIKKRGKKCECKSWGEVERTKKKFNYR